MKLDQQAVLKSRNSYIKMTVKSWSRRMMVTHQNMLLFAGANLSLQATTVICHFVILKFIHPEFMGIWQTVTIIEGYLLVTRFGIVNAMNREYPFFLGKNDQERAIKVVQTAQVYSLFNGILLAFLFLVLGSFYLQKGFQWNIAFLTMTIIVPFQLYVSYLEGTYRSISDFRTLSFLRIGQAPFYFLTLVLPWLYGFSGFCARTVVLTVATTGLCHFFRPVRVKPIFSKQIFKLLVSTGWRLFIWNYLNSVAQSFPRLALALFGGTIYLGLFTPVHWAFMAFNGFAASISAYLYPRLTYRYSKENIPTGQIALKAAVSVMLFLLPIVVICLFVISWIIQSFLSQYSRAIPAIQISLIGSLLECMSIATFTFITIKAWQAMYMYLFCSLLFRSIGAFVGIFIFKDKLVGVSVGMLVSSIIMCVVTWLTVRKTYNQCVIKKNSELNHDQCLTP